MEPAITTSGLVRRFGDVAQCHANQIRPRQQFDLAVESIMDDTIVKGVVDLDDDGQARVSVEPNIHAQFVMAPPIPAGVRHHGSRISRLARNVDSQ